MDKNFTTASNWPALQSHIQLRKNYGLVAVTYDLMCLTVYNGTNEEITKWWVSEWFLRSFHTGLTDSNDEALSKFHASTDFRTFRHEILIAKHVRACRHGILAPGHHPYNANLPLTLNCGDEGHLLSVTGVVVQEDVPDSGVEELNERWAHHWPLHSNSSTSSVPARVYECTTVNVRPTQPSIPPGSVNEYQLRLGRQRQVWFIPLADERGVCR